MLGFLTLLIMAAVAYAYWREGLITSCTMCINVFFAGLVAFNFWEPIANELDVMLKESFLHGYEDCLCLVALFSITLGLLRLITNSLSYTELDYPLIVLRGGGLVFGLLTGYLVAGFLLCAVQTLPLPRNFMRFEAKVEPDKEGSLRRRIIPDRVWLAIMHRAGAGPFRWGDNPTFDRYGNFELRYSRYRRLDENGKPMPNDGACPTGVKK